jgi:hypothetical protein
MSASQPPVEPTVRPGPRGPAARPRPVSKWVWFILLPLLFVARCQGQDGRGGLGWWGELPLGVRLLGGIIVLVGLVQWLQGVYGWSLSRQRPHEPWLWDHPWRQELLGTHPAERVLRLLADLLFPGLLLAFDIACAVFLFKRPSVLGLLGLGLLLCIPFILIRQQLNHHLPRLRTLLRFGRIQLHLPQMPLVLGSHCQVRLSAQHGLAGLTRLQVELQRVVELNLKRVYTGYTHQQEVEVSLAREGEELPLELVLPPEGPESSTVLHGPERTLWILRLKGTASDKELDVRFVLPVYFAEGS